MVTSHSPPIGDLDLLVRKEDLFKVTEVLKGLEFQEMDRRPGFASALLSRPSRSLVLGSVEGDQWPASLKQDISAGAAVMNLEADPMR